MPKRGPKPLSILFIGNSFSYYHAMPVLLACLAKEAKVSDAGVVVDGVFRGGATLKMLFNGKKALKKINSKPWDYIVLQERGRLGGGATKDGTVHVGNIKEFLEYATQFDNAARAVGAKTILYCPPAFVGIKQLNDAKKLDIAYTKVGKKLGAPVIHSGIAFMRALKNRPNIKLFERDGHHPNPLGAYLIATLFYKELFPKKKLPHTRTSFSSKSAAMPRTPKKVTLPDDDVEFVASIAWA